MAVSKPLSIDESASQDAQFRQMVDQLAKEINSFSAGRDKRIEAPPRNRVLKQALRSLAADPPEGHYNNPHNRRAFWQEIDETFKSIGTFTEKPHALWLREATNMVDGYRERALGLFVEDEDMPEDQESPLGRWVMFRGFLRNGCPMSQSECAGLRAYHQDLLAYTDSLVTLYKAPAPDGVDAGQEENLIYEMMRVFDRLRQDESLTDMHESYMAGISTLRHIILNCPIPDYMMEFMEHELTELQKAASKQPPVRSKVQLRADEKDKEEEASPITQPSPTAAIKVPTTDEISDETPVNDQKCSDSQTMAEGIVGYGPIGREVGGRSVAEVQRMAKALENEIDAEYDPQRIHSLLRYCISDFLDGMTQVFDRFIEAQDRSHLGGQFASYLEREKKAAYITSIADALINKIGRGVLRASQQFSSDENVFEQLHSKRNNLGENCFRSASVLTLSCIMGKSGMDIAKMLRNDKLARKIIDEEMSQLTLKAYRDALVEGAVAEEGDLHHFVLNEADSLIHYMEEGEVEEEIEEVIPVESARVMSAPEKMPELNPREVAAMVESLACELARLESAAKLIEEHKEDFRWRLKEIEPKTSRLMELELEVDTLNSRESELKAVMPDVASTEFADWVEACQVLGEEKKDVQAAIDELRAGSLKDPVKEKKFLEEGLRDRDADLQQNRQSANVILSKLQQIKAVCEE